MRKTRHSVGWIRPQDVIHPTAATKHSGFTLIELLVVLLIISISVSFGAIKISGVIENYRLRHTAEKTAALFTFARQQAVLQSTILGLEIQDKQFRLYKFVADSTGQSSGQWQLEAQQKPYNSLTLAKAIQLSHSEIIPIAKDHQSALNPSLIAIFYPDGQITPFELKFNYAAKKMNYSVIGERNGTIVKITK